MFIKKKKWKEGDPVTFEKGLLEQFGNYKIDQQLYKEIPQQVSSTEGTAMLSAIRKSSKLSVRQSASIRHSISRFNINSTILSILMLCVIVLQLILLFRGQ